MKPTSEDLFKRSQQLAPGGVHSPVRAFKSVGGTPIFFKSGKGAYLVSVEGREYIDFCQSFGPLILGHQHPHVAEELKNALTDGWVFGASEPYSVELAQFVVDNVPAVEKIRFVTSGTEAVMSALRVARAATNKTHILKFEGCYHGHADSMLVKAGSGLGSSVGASDSAGVTEAVAQQTVVAPLDDEKAFDGIFNQHKDNLAAVILEPLPANYGLLTQRVEWIKHVVNRAQKAKVLVIFDEVISGFRASLGGMATQLNLKPDLITYGKILGGGLSVGAYGGRRDLMDLVAPSGPVYQAGTLSASPLTMRAGLATLGFIKKEKVHETLALRTKTFAENLNNFFKDENLPWTIEFYESLFWIRPQSDQTPRSLKTLPDGMAEKFKMLYPKLLEQGVYLPPSSYEVGFVSLAHTTEILGLAEEKIKKAFRELN